MPGLFVRDEPMRVVHVEGGTYSGSTRVVLDLCARVDPARFASAICYFAVLPPAERTRSETHRLGIPYRSVVKRSRYDATAPARLERALTELRPDIVFLHGFGAYALGTLPARRSGARRVVRVEHQPERGSTFRTLASAVSASWADATLSVSRFLLDDAAAQGIVLPAPQVIPNGIDLAPFAAIRRPPFAEANGETTITMIARLDVQKDHLTLLRAAARLRASGRRFRLRFAGDGPLSQVLQASCTELGLGQSVEWLGFRPDIVPLLEETDIAVLSTHYEGFGLSIIEAMAAARPTVATAVGAIPELIGATGTARLVEPGDADALADVLIDLHDHPGRARALGERARAHVTAHFSLDSTVRLFEEYSCGVLR